MALMKYSPIMTVSQFAEGVGVSEGVVTGWIKREYIPTHKVGRHRLVNVAKVNHKALFGGEPSSYEQELETEKHMRDFKAKTSEETSLEVIEGIRSEFKSANRATRKALLKKHGDEDAVVGKLYIESLKS